MRIVSHTCSNTEIVCALGAGHLLVGVDEHSDYPEDIVGRLPKVGPDLDIDVDKVLSLKPDLVLTSLTVPGHEVCVERLQQAGLNVYVSDPRSLQDVAENIRSIGALIGFGETAESVAAEFESALYSEKQTINSDSVNRPRILVEWWPKPVIVPGADSWVTDLIELAGGVNPWADEMIKSRPVTDDEVIAENPDAVVISWCGVKEEKYHPHIVTRRPEWQSVNAIQTGHIMPISEALLGRPGPRLIEGLERLRLLIRDITTTSN